jgi:uncharacterized protein
MMLPDNPAPLTRPELLRLERFLRSNESGEGAMSLSHAHGFLTAIVSGPESFETGEWIRLIFDEPVFSDSEQAQDILGLIVRVHAGIEAALPVPGRFLPIFEYDHPGGRGATYRSEQWCQGYISAMALWSAPLTRTLRYTLEPLFLIASPQSRAQRELQEAHYRELCALLPPMAEAVYRHWHGNTGQDAKQ